MSHCRKVRVVWPTSTTGVNHSIKLLPQIGWSLQFLSFKAFLHRIMPPYAFLDHSTFKHRRWRNIDYSSSDRKLPCILFLFHKRTPMLQISSVTLLTSPNRKFYQVSKRGPLDSLGEKLMHSPLDHTAPSPCSISLFVLTFLFLYFLIFERFPF